MEIRFTKVGCNTCWTRVVDSLLGSSTAHLWKLCSVQLWPYSEPYIRLGGGFDCNSRLDLFDDCACARMGQNPQDEPASEAVYSVGSVCFSGTTVFLWAGGVICSERGRVLFVPAFISTLFLTILEMS